MLDLVVSDAHVVSSFDVIAASLALLYIEEEVIMRLLRP